MGRIASLVFGILALLFLAAPAQAQSGCVYIVPGAVLTAGQWNYCFQQKLDNPGYVPLNPGNVVGVSPITVTPSAGILQIACPTCTTGRSSSFAAAAPLAVTFPSGIVTYALNFNATLALDGSNNLGINLANPNTWTATQTINPPSGTTTQGLLVTNIGPASGSTAGPLIYNGFNIVQSATVTGAGTDTYGLLNSHVDAFRANLTVSGNAAGGPFVSGVFAANVTATGAHTETIGLLGSAYTNVADGATASLSGSWGFAEIGPSGSLGGSAMLVGAGAEVGIVSGGSAPYRFGLLVRNVDALSASTLDAAIGFNNQAAIGGAFTNLFALNTFAGVSASIIKTTGNFFFSDAAITVGSIFNLSNVTVTGNILNFPDVVLTGAGVLTLGKQQSVQGVLALANTAAGAFGVAIQSSNSATATWTWTLPTAAPAGNGYLMSFTTAGVASFVAPSSVAVTTFSAGTTGLTPNSATAGAITLAGTLVVANGGTNCAVASITCFNNITGFSAAGTTGTTSTNLVFSTSPTLVTPVLGAATGTSLALGGATIGGNALAVTGTVLFNTALGVASGGTNCATASITCFNNITGFSAAGTTGTTSTNLVFSTSPSITTPTFVTSATGPLFIGGSGTTGTQLTFQTTTGNGTTDAFVWKRGNNGGTTAATLNNTGLMVGATAPVYEFNVNNNAAAIPSNPGGVGSFIVAALAQADNSQGSLGIFASGSGQNAQASIKHFSSAGTLASPTHSTSGNYLGSNFWYGYGNAYVPTAGFIAVAAEDFSATAGGTALDIYTTPLTTQALAASTRFFPSGGVGIGETGTDPGIGSLQLNAQMFMPNITTSSAAQTGTVCWTTATGKFTADTTLGCLASSARWKKNVRPFDGTAIAEIERLQVRLFDWRNPIDVNQEGDQLGMIAEEVYAIDPMLAGVGSDHLPKAWRQDSMVAMLVKGLQELKADNDNLRREIAQLRKVR